MINAIYCRQSLDKKDSISIETQIDLCKKQFDSKEKHKVYTDKGYSGKNTNRPDFESLMADIRAGIVNRVIVYRLDRISRSTLDFANMMDNFNRYNVEFISATEKFDTSTPMGKAMLQIIMVFAELERSTIQLRITDNYYTRGKKGFFMGGRVPYGFNKEKTNINGVKTSKLIEDIEQSTHLIKMFDMYSSSDISLGKVSDYFNEKDIPAPNGGRWDSNKISRMLRNPVYVRADADIYSYYVNKGCQITNDVSDFIGVYGCFLYGKREANERKYTNVKDHVLSLSLHKGLIDSHTWLLCQYKLDTNKQIKNSGKGKYTWLSGVAKCGYCGYAVSVVTSDGKYKYFNCRGKTNLKICSGHSRVIHVDEVEDIVEAELKTKVEELQGVKYEIGNKDDATINKIKIQLVEIDKQIENLVIQMAEANNVVISYINKKIKSLDNTKNNLLEELKKTTIQNKQNKPIGEMIKQVKEWDKLDLEQKKVICKSMVNKVFIRDDSIEFDWKI